MCVATRSRNHRSWVITTAHPAKSSSASSSARSVSTSRSFVGSSSRSTLPPLRSSFARCTRLRSPPERSDTRFCWSEPLKLNQETYWREFTSFFPSSNTSAPPLLSVQLVLVVILVLRLGMVVPVGPAAVLRLPVSGARAHPHPFQLAG